MSENEIQKYSIITRLIYSFFGAFLLNDLINHFKYSIEAFSLLTMGEILALGFLSFIFIFAAVMGRTPFNLFTK